MTIRPARFNAGDLDRMYPAAFVDNVVAAVRRGDYDRAIGLFDVWLSYPWDFHGDEGMRVDAFLGAFHNAVDQRARLPEIEQRGQDFLQAWTDLLEDFVLFLVRGELESERKREPLAERLHELEQTYAAAGFAAMPLEQIEELLANHPNPDDYLEARRRLLAIK
ncbi:hypothetical protein Ocepr_2310 (plasmid) [Oceanithermus profundus DSM 14977]|uniref:Uncharacterized protein n=1 Tax=Oceanithermus profundus (strain DSM 14977 / NBRC 100410 / VKM B-2274 / 506) TaxID=670487 RepID=E4UAX3_OCEP5|nr:hypothetical protein [Oceanithermus profundus]ADR37758.1 hypothetical protein Ocepr_2310 [Oceanithermus profundus DSM 14977]